MVFIPQRCLFVNMQNGVIKNNGMYWSGKSKKTLAKIWNCKEEDIKETYGIQYNQNIFYVENNKIYRTIHGKAIEQKLF